MIDLELLTILMIPTGVLIGIMVGALPGLTATMAIAVLLPFTFGMEPLPGLMLLLGIYGGALYAGSIPAILLRIPGTPSAAAATLEGYPMTQAGQAGRALTLSIVASSVGGMVGVGLLVLAAPVFSDLALGFGPGEYVMLAVFALTVIVTLSETNLVKGLASGVVGMVLATIGLDVLQPEERFTLGLSDLRTGIEFIPVLIGLFGVAEALRHLERSGLGGTPNRSIGTMRVGWRRLLGLGPTLGGSSVLGFGIGVLPGVGGDTGAFVAYSETKRFARRDRRFGRGDPRGLVAAEAANNASTAGALVPMLSLGIPGDAATAIMIGAITVHGLRPGPELFESSPELTSGIFVGFFLVYLVLLVVGLAGAALWIRILKVPTHLLWPVVLVLSVVGAYALRSSVFDVIVMLAAGVLGYLMHRAHYPLVPLVLGLLIGPIAESNFRRAMIVHRGRYEWMLEPLPLVLASLAALSLLVPGIRALRRHRGETARAAQR